MEKSLFFFDYMIRRTTFEYNIRTTNGNDIYSYGFAFTYGNLNGGSKISGRYSAEDAGSCR